MADIFTASNAYHGTFVTGTIESEPVFQICAVANINASNLLEITFWVNENGSRLDSNLGQASYIIRDKTGAAVAGLTESGLAADINGYYQTTAITAANIYDLNHYVLEISIAVDGVEKNSSIGLVRGE